MRGSGRRVLYQIIGLTVGGVFLFSLVLWTSVISIVEEMNQKTFTDSITAVESRVMSIREQVRLIASDYHNWSDVYAAVERKDIQFISDNYGITAARGDVFEYAEIFDGPFDQPIAWTAGSGLDPVDSFLPPQVLERILAESQLLPMGYRKTFDFVTFIDGKLVMFSASLMLPEDISKIRDVPVSELAGAAVGKILTSDKLKAVEQELNLANLRLEPAAPGKGVPSISLNGYDNQPAIYMAWDPPRPGSEVLARMLPILIAVNGLFLSVGIFVARQAHVNATNLIRKEAEAARQARTDHLSQLPNRLAFAEYCDALDRDLEAQVAVIQIDMDRFKQVNDVIGHAGGDELICQFSERLLKLKDDDTFVARVGGDEFVVICACRDGTANFWRAKLEELEKILAVPVHCAGLYFDLSASIGVALKGPDRDPIQDVVWRSDRAMYHAKQQQIPGFVLYDELMSAGDQARNAIEKAMRYALRNSDEFYIEYQPIVDAVNGEVMLRAEALARWHSPLLGDVMPSKFIPVAEQTGLIVPLGWLLLDLICKDLVDFPGLKISLNVSPVQLMAPGFVDEFCARVQTHGLDCSRIDIELTETLAIQGDSHAMEEVRRLKNLGFSISLDDFGTGFSSLSYVRQIPFNAIKIDKSFISGGEVLRDDYCLVSAIVSLAESMGKDVIAEGVETERQLSWLRSIGCRYVQGYLFGRPERIGSLALRFGLHPSLRQPLSLDGNVARLGGRRSS